MAKFKINENVIVNDGSNTGIIVGIDSLSYPLPLYEIKINETGDIMSYYEPAIKKMVNADDVVRYGDILTDDNLYSEMQYPDGFENHKWIRIRTVRYESRIFYHKMINGETVEFKELD